MIIDEILVLFLAGSKTVQLTIANMFCYLGQNKEYKVKLQEEIDSQIGLIADDIQGKFDQETTEKLEFLRRCFNETLRIEPPVAISTFQTFT